MTIERRETAEAGRAAARLMKGLEVALGQTGLSLPQYRLLLFLSGGAERATALAAWLDVSPPSLTALVDGAVSRGLVQRVPLEEDRRCVRHEITALGHEKLSLSDGVLVDKLGSVVSYLEPDEAEKAIDGLRLLGKALDAIRAEKDANDAAQIAGTAR